MYNRYYARLQIKVNYKKSAAEHAGIMIKEVNWILKKFFKYAAMMLMHGFTIKIIDKFHLIPYYIVSSDFEWVEKEWRYARSAAIHGVFFSVRAEGGILKRKKYTFKPTQRFRQRMEEHLEDPDLTYKLIES